MSLYSVSIDVLGEPKPQPRPRACIRGRGPGGRHASVYNPATAEGWKAAIAAAFKEWLPDRPVLGPVQLTIQARLPRPAAHWRKWTILRPSAPRWPTAQRIGDVDNLAKAVMDVLTGCRVWVDDAQVVRLDCSKRYAYAGERPGALIAVIELGVP
jgi:Holliday junction resolvase RusA-like endonuclease